MGRNDEFDRVGEFLLHRESPRYIGSSSQPAVQTPIRSRQAYDYGEQHTRPPPSSPTYSSRSSVSRSSVSSRRYSGSDTSSTGQSSRSSAPSVAPPWQPPPPTLNQTLTMAPYPYGYDLPCEFTFAGCHLRFHPEAFEEWINHSISHFGVYGPPTRTVCSFCDREFDCTHNPDDAVGNWWRRMEHIGRHFYESRRMDGVEVNHRRPDFWILDHMRSFRLISREDYSQANEYTERPYCENTYPLGWRTPEMLAREQRNAGTSHDLRKEQQQIKKEKGRSSRTHRPRS